MKIRVAIPSNVCYDCVNDFLTHDLLTGIDRRLCGLSRYKMAAYASGCPAMVKRGPEPYRKKRAAEVAFEAPSRIKKRRPV
jgi:hypothetical protein